MEKKFNKSKIIILSVAILFAILTFSIGIPAASVEVQKDGGSILISKDIEIRPPTLTPCILKTSGKEYSVIFAGATHTIGKYINIPFIIVE